MVHWHDAAAWIAAIVAGLALIISCCSAVLSWKSLRWERLSAEASMRSAEAAERAYRLAERAVAAQQRVQLFGIPSEEAFGTPSVETELAPDVSWRIERQPKIGTCCATPEPMSPSMWRLTRRKPGLSHGISPAIQWCGPERASTCSSWAPWATQCQISSTSAGLANPIGLLYPSPDG